MENTCRLNIKFIPQVYEKRSVDEVIDRSFSEFGQKVISKERTVEEFFRDYEDLYFKIPVEGTYNSHQYLVEKSSQIYRPTAIVDQIQPLLDEINQLRSQVVSYQQEIIDLNIRLTKLQNNSTGETD